jgi:hypothetical protein
MLETMDMVWVTRWIRIVCDDTRPVFVLKFVVNLSRGPVEGIQCTSSYVEKTTHT